MKTKPWALIVEDDANLRTVMRRILEDDGFRVDGCGKATGAIAICADASPRPDLMVLDLHLPEVTGLHLLRGLRRIGIQVPTLVVSGLFESLDPGQLKRIGAHAFLGKPFESDGFARIARDLIRPQAAVEKDGLGDRRSGMVVG